MTTPGLLRRRVTAATTGLLLVATGVIAPLVAAGPASATTVTPGWQPDANDLGPIAFYDAAGHVKTSGLLTDVPMAAYYVVPGATADHGYAATSTPVEGANSGSWSSTQIITSTQSFPKASLPGDLAGSTAPVVPDNSGQSLQQNQIDIFPNSSTTAGYQNLYEVRVYTGATSASTNTSSWYAADVLVDPTAGTWSQVYPNTVTVPGAPTALAATGGNTKALLSWTAPASTGGAPIASYHVTATPDVGPAVVADTPTGATSYTLNGLTNGTGYSVTVAATNSAGTGPGSDAALVTPTTTVPGAPTGVTATPHDGSASVAFTAPADSGDGSALSYTVTASTGQTATGTSSPISVPGLANGTSRTFTVTATNTVGTSAASAVSNAVAFYTTGLSLAAVPTVVNAGSVITEPGTLTGGPVSGKHVNLTIYTAGHLTRTVVLTTNSAGAFAYGVRVSYTTSFRATYAATATQRAATSVTRKTVVNAVIRITSPTNGTRTHTRTLAVVGTTSPNKAGSVVGLYERRGTSYVLLAQVRVASNGTYRFVRTFTKATHVLQVRIGATSTNGAGSSNLVILYEV